MHAGLLSYHLRVLREAGLVRAAPRGARVDYTITAEAWTRMCTPNLRPSPWTYSASGPKPRPSRADGNRFGAGYGRPTSSSTSAAYGR